MIRVGNDKLLIDDKELKRLVKEGYDRGCYIRLQSKCN